MTIAASGTPTTRPNRWWPAALLLATGLIGCTRAEVDTAYGKSRGKSINGTNALFDLLRQQGHPVRAAIRYNETLGDWADVLVRFAPSPGPVSAAEAKWLDEWLLEDSTRKLVYVIRDYDSAPEFWARMRATLPAKGMDAERARIEARADASRSWVAKLPPPTKTPAKVAEWFGTTPSNPAKPREVATCRTLEGPWAAGVDPQAAALPKREAIQVEGEENVYLSGDGSRLIIGWTLNPDEDEEAGTRGGVLVVANGSFLLNAALLNKARRPLADRVVAWIGAGTTKVAFVEGTEVLAAEDDAGSSPFHLFTVAPFNWVFAHLAAFGALLCLSLAATIGRPRPEPAGEIDRPSAHPIALGAILARTQQAALAREILAAYRRWRHPAGASHRTDPASSSPR